MKQNLDNQVSLFDISNNEQASNSKLDVVKMQYIEATALSWRELFSGYDHLHAITFSSGINFIYQLTELFENVEIIFGCEEILTYSIQDILAFQAKLIDRIRETEAASKSKLFDRIEKGTVHFLASRGQLSHEKIYLLSADDGRKRVIMGSANMSFNAFGGRQRENICYLDDEAAYEWYKIVYDQLRENSTDEITYKSIMVADAEENIDELPIAGTVKAKKVVVIEPVKENADDVRFVLDTKNLSEKIKPLTPKPEKKSGKLMLTSDILTKIKRTISDDIKREKDLRSEYPQLNVDVYDGTVSLNGQPLDLNPSNEDISKDIELFVKYMDGYEKFHGDSEGMQLRYFEFANWFFCSPFMAAMRDAAARFDVVRLPYPVFGLVYGQSKAGKTSFLETLLKMMIGQKPKISAPDFTRSSIEGLKRTVEGAPIIVDDLTNTRFNQHAIETIKNDDFGISDHMVNYPAVVISANEDVKAVAPEVIRRTIICRVEAGLTNTEVMKSNNVRYVQQNIGTAFYREYLRRMLDMIPDLIEQIQNSESESAPDILRISSEIIVEIFSEYLKNIPKYIRNLSLENYFSEQVTGKHAMKVIRDAWKTNRKSFQINKRANELRYNAGAPYEADRLMKELPETLEIRKSRELLIMNLSQAKDFFDIDFKASFFSSISVK